VNSVGVRMHGVRLRLSSDNAPLVDYAREHLQGLVESPAGAPALEVRCLWSEGAWDATQNPFTPGAPLARIGKRMLGNPDELIWLDTQRMQGLQLRIRLERARWSFEVAYRYHPAQKHAHEVDDYRYRKYFSLMSYLVYYPIFWHLERTRGCAVVHASALGTSAGAVLIGGLGGVGKTTLSVALSRMPGFSLGAENLTLADGVGVYPCVEPIRLDPQSLSLLGGAPGLTPMRFPPGVKDKHLYHHHAAQPARVAAEPEREAPWVARAIFLPQFSSRRLIRLDPGLAAERLSAMNRLTLEIDDYTWFTSALDLHWPQAGHSLRRLRALEALTRRTPCFELGVDPTAGVDAAVEDVMRALD